MQISSSPDSSHAANSTGTAANFTPIIARVLINGHEKVNYLELRQQAQVPSNAEVTAWNLALSELKTDRNVILNLSGVSRITDNIASGLMMLFRGAQQSGTHISVLVTPEQKAELLPTYGRMFTFIDSSKLPASISDSDTSELNQGLLSIMQAYEVNKVAQYNPLNLAAIGALRGKGGIYSFPSGESWIVYVSGNNINTKLFDSAAFIEKLNTQPNIKAVMFDLVDCVKFNNKDAELLGMLYLSLKKTGIELQVKFRPDSSCAENHLLGSIIKAGVIKKIESQ